MNKKYIILFKKLAVLLLVLMAVDVSLGKLLTHYYLKMKTGQSARITYAMTKANEEIIVFGSSRANHNYIPDILKDSLHLRAYNAGIDGQSILYHYCVLKNILLRPKPGIIILDLNIDEFEKGELSYNKLYALLPYYTICKNIQPIINLRSSYESIKTISNLYRFNSFILSIILNNTLNRIDDSKNGYIPLYRVLESKSKIQPEIKKSVGLDTMKINIFKSFLAEAKKANCKVFVFISPIYQNQHKVSSTILTAEQISRQEQVSLVNYSESSFFNTHPEYFQDELHLNNNGAELYTRMIYDEIRKRLP